jgi:hypothetical protein
VLASNSEAVFRAFSILIVCHYELSYAELDVHVRVLLYAHGHACVAAGRVKRMI